MQVFSLGSIGIRLQAEAAAYFEDGKDPLSAEQRGALDAVLALHGLFIRLVPEWRELVADAEASEITAEATTQAIECVEPLAAAMENEPDAYDTSIPQALRFLRDTVVKVGTAVKPMSLAFVRGLSNMLSVLGRFFITTALKTLDKTSDRVSDGVSKALGAAVAATILAGAASLSPLSKQLPQIFHWLEPLLNVIRQQSGILF